MTPDHLVVEVVALASAFAHAGEHRVAAVVHGDVVDELLDHDGLADAGAAEEPRLAALRVRLEQVDDLDPRLEHLDRGRLLVVGRRIAVDGPALLGLDRPEAVDLVADHVEDAPQGLPAHRDRDRPALIERLHAADHSVRRLHRDAPHHVLAELLRDLRDDVDLLAGLLAFVGDLDRVVDRRELALRELDVQDRPDDRDDPAFGSFRHEFPLLTLCATRAPRRPRRSRSVPS
jgi:hypothetical protein